MIYKVKEPITKDEYYKLIKKYTEKGYYLNSFNLNWLWEKLLEGFNFIKGSNKNIKIITKYKCKPEKWDQLISVLYLSNGHSLSVINIDLYSK